MQRRFLTGFLLTLLLLTGLAPATTAAQRDNQIIELQILATNDQHGQVTTGRTVGGRPIGGAAYLGAYIDRERAENPDNTLLVHAGDAVGASPPVSALLQDEPMIEAMNAMGYDLGVVGNHEFDEGVDELYHLLNGGCHPVTGCFGGADFPYLAANVVWEDTGQPILPPYEIFKYKNVRVGFIGVVTTETPSIVVQGTVDGLEFLDEAETVNRYVDELRRQKVETIIVLIHKGGFSTTPTSPVTGDIVDFANAVDDEVDVIVSGHTHRGYITEIDGKLVTQAWSYTTALTDIDLQIDRKTRDVVGWDAELIDTWNDAITPDPEIATMVAGYEALVAPLINREVGTAATDITRADPAGTGETALGNLIADAQRWKMGTDFAFMNPGGIREDIFAGPVTWGEMFSVQPFGNDLVAMDLTGAQIYTLLEQQWQPDRTRFLQISGLEYDYDPNQPAGNRVIEVRDANGVPLDMQTAYRVVVNSFLAGGGDNFTVLTEGVNREIGPVDLDALVEYIEQLPQPFSATIEGRITIVP